MGKTTKNILIILGILSIGFAGYYLYNERFATTLQFDSDSETLTNMLNNTQVFMERNRVLQRTKLDVEIFEDQQFRSLRGFTGPVAEVPAGRPDPFAETSFSPVTPPRQ